VAGARRGAGRSTSRAAPGTRPCPPPGMAGTGIPKRPGTGAGSASGAWARWTPAEGHSGAWADREPSGPSRVCRAPPVGRRLVATARPRCPRPGCAARARRQRAHRRGRCRCRRPKRPLAHPAARPARRHGPEGTCVTRVGVGVRRCVAGRAPRNADRQLPDQRPARPGAVGGQLAFWRGWARRLDRVARDVVSGRGGGNRGGRRLREIRRSSGIVGARHRPGAGKDDGPACDHEARKRGGRPGRRHDGWSRHCRLGDRGRRSRTGRRAARRACPRCRSPARPKGVDPPGAPPTPGDGTRRGIACR